MYYGNLRENTKTLTRFRTPRASEMRVESNGSNIADCSHHYLAKSILQAMCFLLCCSIHHILCNRTGGVMVSVLASSAVDRGFQHRSCQTTHYKIGMCHFSTKHAALRSQSKEWFARNQDI